MYLRKEIGVIVVLLVIVIVLALVIQFYKTNIEKDDVKNFILEDLKTKHPNADITEIISMELKTNEGGEEYYSIKGRVTEGLDSGCPVRIHYSYTYPSQKFVTQPPEYITQGCEVCTTSPCFIAFEEEAIIASHTLSGTESVHEFISTNDVYPTVNEVEEGWEVVWDSPDSEVSYNVIISSSGEVISKEMKVKSAE